MNNGENDTTQELIEDDGVQSQEQIDRAIAAEIEHDSRAEADRAAILERRRARQSGKSFGGIGKRKGIAALLFAGTAGAMIYVSSGALFGGTTEGEAAVAASKVNLEVEKEKAPKEFKIDLSAFNVPTPPPVKADNKGDEMEVQLEKMKRELDEIKGAPKPDSMSKESVDAMIDKMNKQFEEKLAGERQAMQAENQRQKAEEAMAAEMARQQQEAEKLQQEMIKKEEDLKTKQRESGLLILDGSEEGAALGASQAAGQAAGSAIGNGGILGSGLGVLGGVVGGSKSSGNQNQEFLASSADSSYTTTYAKSLANPSKTIVQGTIISGVLETAIDTQLPGNIRAQVIEPVFSFDGSHILMPAGTMLIGTFNSNVEFEQKRVLIAWNRAITPDGDSIAIGGIGADLLGRSGTAGNVDNRYAKKFGAATLISAINIAPAILSAKLAPPVANTSTTGQPAVSLNVGGGGGGGKSNDPFSQMASGVGAPITDVLNQYLDLPPIIRVAQGEEIRIFVNRDLIFR
jgi:type IV secretion system protein VirB10